MCAAVMSSRESAPVDGAAFTNNSMANLAPGPISPARSEESYSVSRTGGKVPL